MIAKTLSIIAANWWFYLFFAVILLVAAGVVEAGYVKSGSGVVNVMLWLIFARFVHRAALFGVKFGAPNPDGTPDRFFGGFLFKGLTLLIIALIPALPVLIWSIGAKLTSPANPTFADIYPFAIAYLVTYAIVLSLAGSWLPASVYRKNTGLGAALTRGAGNFFSVFIRIAPTMLLAVAVEFAALIAISVNGFGLSILRDGAINPVGTLALFVVTLIEAVSITLISVILSHYYLVAEGVDDRATVAG